MNTIFIRLTIITNIILIINAIQCDFDKFTNGCEDSFGSQCNKTSNECQCKFGFNIKIDNYCLPSKNWSESCYISAQCIQTRISNIGCYTEDKEIDIITLKSWINSGDAFKIIGVCKCSPKHLLSVTRKECVTQKLFNDNCSSSQECISTNSYCDQLTNKCKCKPTYRYSVRKNRCVSHIIGDNCTHNEHCVIHDTNAECRIGSCQCRSGFIMSSSGKCAYIRVKGTSNHLLMMLIVVGTAILFALLSTAHRKWATTEDIYDRSRSQVLVSGQNPSLMRRRTFETNNNCHTNISRMNCHQSYPMPLSVPSLALIWPIRQQNESQMNQNYLEDGPPSYEEAISQSISQSDINTLTIHDNSNSNDEITNHSIDNKYNNSTIISNTNV